MCTAKKINKTNKNGPFIFKGSKGGVENGHEKLNYNGFGVRKLDYHECACGGFK